jgi:bleomycin hydrolase
MKLKSGFFQGFCFGLLFLSLQGWTQDQKKDEKEPGYQFTVTKEVKRTPVKNQARTGTCWCFATISYLESEMLRTGKEETDLSEMFVVRHAYPKKAVNYVRLHGSATFGQGGQSHDVIEQIREFGIIPEEVYSGMKIGEKTHNHGEMVSVLQAMLDGVLKQRGSRLTPQWQEAFDAVLDVYLGESPKSFMYKGKTYTPKKFAEEYVGLNMDDYIELTSYSHHPYYQPCRLEIPDNWTLNDQYYNIPMDDFEAVIDFALENGYSVAWDGDVSERDFSSRETGYAVVPIQDWEDKTQAERKMKVVEPVEEKEITDAMRQETFDNFTTTDDHLMHIVGLAQDQNGARFYLTKNSSGPDRIYDGYLYMSRAYVRLKSIAMMVHKDALPSKIKKKLGIK